ncbi:hypothetical protein OROGR_028145 [Orobanche gracilis]
MAAASLAIGWISSPSCYSYSRSRVRCSLKPPPKTPWLTLLPEETSYKFYSVAEDRVLSLKKERGTAAAPRHDALLVGSSHGCLALFEEESNRVFLSNPISGRHITLPPFPWEPIPYDPQSRIILSCSPDDGDECYAVQDYPDPSAYCAIGATEWALLDTYERLFYGIGDLAYCSSRRALSLITGSMFEFDSAGVRVVHDRSADHQIEYWDLGSNSIVETTWFWKFQGPPHHWKKNEDGEFLSRCFQKLYLVYAGAGASSPLIVVRFFGGGASSGFVVLEMDGKSRSIRVVDDLKGLALFIGANHSFAIPANGTLKPNSIYFAPPSIIKPRGGYGYGNGNRINDLGIFDYESKTFSRFNIDNKLQLQLGECPMWFSTTG